MTKRCKYCGKHFKPDRRIRERQKACQRQECKRKRKKEAQKNWSEKNPGYFKGRYPYVKEWRQKKKRSVSSPAAKQDKIREKKQEMIQDKIPPSKALEELILLIPAGEKRKIQDEIRLKRVDRHTFAAYG